MLNQMLNQNDESLMNFCLENYLIIHTLITKQNTRSQTSMIVHIDNCSEDAFVDRNNCQHKPFNKGLSVT